jgi:hypothetical protein
MYDKPFKFIAMNFVMTIESVPGVHFNRGPILTKVVRP